MLKKYDPFGRRVEKSVSGTSTRYVYDNEDILFEYNNARALAAKYTHGPGVDEPLSVDMLGKLYYYNADGLGSVTALTDSTGQLVRGYSYAPFGMNGTVLSPELLQPYAFTGREYDQETGLYYYRNRYYDENTGRFISKDPIGFESGDINHYRYVFNNPINHTDPSGLAYFAKRPLSGFPWLGPLSCNSGSIDDISNTEISHEHLFFEDGKEPSNVGCSRKGLFTETFPQGYRCRSGKYNDCIMRKAASKVPCIYSAARSNCQDWAALVRSEYQKLEMDSKIQEECRCAK